MKNRKYSPQLTRIKVGVLYMERGREIEGECVCVSETTNNKEKKKIYSYIRTRNVNDSRIERRLEFENDFVVDVVRTIDTKAYLRKMYCKNKTK